MKLPAPKNNTIALTGGVRYDTSATIQLNGKGRVTVTGAGRPVINGGGLPKNGSVFEVPKGGDWQLPPIDYIVPKDRNALRLIGGSLMAEGDTAQGDRMSRVTGGGLLLLAQQAELCSVRNYIYEGAPEKYVVFAGDPMQRYDPKWKMDGYCRNLRLDNITAVGHRTGARQPSEARFRFMAAEGDVSGLAGDTTQNYDPKDPLGHKQCFQFRGRGGRGERCRFVGSVIYGPLNPKQQGTEYQRVAPSIPPAYFFHNEFTGVGYVMAERAVTALLGGWRITAVDPRAPRKTECFSATGGATLILVGCEVEAFDKFATGNCIIGDGCRHKGKPVPVTKGWEKATLAAAQKANKYAY